MLAGMSKPPLDPLSPDAVEPWGPASAEAKRLGLDLALILHSLQLTPHERMLENDAALRLAETARKPGT
jgi:hypothetical protein